MIKGLCWRISPFSHNLQIRFSDHFSCRWWNQTVQNTSLFLWVSAYPQTKCTFRFISHVRTSSREMLFHIDRSAMLQCNTSQQEGRGFKPFLSDCKGFLCSLCLASRCGMWAWMVVCFYVCTCHDWQFVQGVPHLSLTDSRSHQQWWKICQGVH